MIVLRSATPADVPVLAGLEEALFGAEAWSEAAVRADVDSALRQVTVVEVEGVVAGYVVTSVVEADDPVDLLRIGVSPTYRRSGLGARLLATTLADAPRVLLEVSDRNEAATALYRRHGFVEIDRRRRYYADGSDALVMERGAGSDNG